MKKKNIKKIVFIFIVILSITRIIAVTPISDIKTDIDNGYLLGENTQPKVIKTSDKAKKTGLEIGDIIYKLNEKKAEDQLKVREFFFKNKGETVKVEVLREDQLVIVDFYIPQDFQPFGYESDFNFIDKEIIQTGNLEIIFYHLFLKGFETDPNFPNINKAVFTYRTVNYLGSITVIVASYFLLIKKKSTNNP